MLNPHTFHTPRTLPAPLVSAPELQALLHGHLLGSEANADQGFAEASEWRSNGIATGKAA